MTEGYNGWTNQNTWAVNLHLSNDEGSYRYVNDLAERSWNDNDDVDGYTGDLANALKEYVEGDDGIDSFGIAWAMDGDYLLLCDLLRYALSDVDYFEIARAWVDDPESWFDPKDVEED